MEKKHCQKLMLINQILLISTKHVWDMIGWEELDSNTSITPVVTCKVYTGIVSTDGVENDLCAQYIDDALLLGHSRPQILMKLALLIKANFVIIGKSDITVRQCPLAMDKWEELIVGPV